MKILVINADCLQVNSSANLCHLAYINGLVELGYDVDVLSADGRDYCLDPNMKIPSAANSYTYYGVSLYEKLSLLKKKNVTQQTNAVSVSNQKKTDASGIRKIVQNVKRSLLRSYGPHGIYLTFAKKASIFRSETVYDYILSISTPPATPLPTI